VLAMTERGWGWTASQVRQVQLVESLVSDVDDKDSVAGWDIPVEPFYRARFPDRSDNAVFEIAIGDLEALKGAGLVEFQQSLGGLRAVHVQVTGRARDQVEEWREIRASTRLRRTACREALVDWLYGRDAVTDMPPFPAVDDMLADPRHGLWFAEPFARADVDAASAWLERQALIKGPKADQRSGPIRAYLTDAGVSCAADFDCRTDAYIEALRRVPSSGPTVNIHGGNNGPFQVAGNDAHQVQNIGASADDLRLLIAGIAEFVRTFVPDAAEDSVKQQDAAIAAITAVSVDESALQRFRDWAVTTAQTGVNTALVALVSSATTFLLMEAARLAMHMG
jgi:hypothetical protein